MRQPRLPRLSSTGPGRAVLTAFLVVTLVTIVAANLPESPLRRILSTLTQPYANAVGLDQRWNVFAPNPRSHSLSFEARLVYADGGVTTWRVPHGGPVLGAYWDYRWRKWAERVTADAFEDDLWEETASWLARREAERGRAPKKVTLVRRWRDLNPPGVDPETGPWRSYAFYSWRPGSPQRLGG